MAFLEPWLAGRGVIARRLSNVVADFLAAGVRLERFYDAIEIPGNPSWIAECRREAQHAFKSAWSVLPENARPEEASAAYASDGVLDFGRLIPARQIEVLRRMCLDSGFEREIALRNESLIQSLNHPFDQAELQHNAQCIRTHFSLPRAGDRLLDVYHQLMSTRELPKEMLNENRISNNPSESIIDLICRTRPFFPCRTESEIVS